MFSSLIGPNSPQRNVVSAYGTEFFLRVYTQKFLTRFQINEWCFARSEIDPWELRITQAWQFRWEEASFKVKVTQHPMVITEIMALLWDRCFIHRNFYCLFVTLLASRLIAQNYTAVRNNFTGTHSRNTDRPWNSFTLQS